MHTREKGRSGEDIAAEHLLGSGYRIVSRNYQTRDGEIDCVAESPDGTLVFVEVKASRSNARGHPFYRITRAKQRQLVRMARRYLFDHHIGRQACRFDVIAVVNGQVEHMKNAFWA